MSEAGHKFLAKLGKKQHAGGKRATDWLIAEGEQKKKRIEVARVIELQQLSWLL